MKSQLQRRKRHKRLTRQGIKKAMSFNTFQGHTVKPYSGEFESPGERALHLLLQHRASVAGYLATEVENVEMVMWGDDAGPINNMIAYSEDKQYLRKLKSYELSLAKEIKVVKGVFDDVPSSCFIDGRSGSGVKLYYDRVSFDFLDAIKVGDIKAIRVVVTCAPGPAADWVESFTYLAVRREDVQSLARFISNIHDNHSKNPVFHTVKARGSVDDVEVPEFSWDQVILDPNVLKAVKDDFRSFFDRKDWFKQKKLPFRRGYMFHGDPGNGKTSTIRAMMWDKGVDAYTLSFHDKNVGLDELNQVFESAAESAPSLVILEDIDRAFPKGQSKCSIELQELLNAIDGIGTKEGIITIATANDPASLDPAILKRPGRFDRTIKFASPGSDLRRRYFLTKDESIVEDEDFNNAIKESEGYSFAQLQESYILAGQRAYDEETLQVTGAMVLSSVRTLSESNKGVKNRNAVGFRD